MVFFAEVHPCDMEGKGGCQQICIKDGDESKCSCDDGFELQPDGKSCGKKAGKACR